MNLLSFFPRVTDGKRKAQVLSAAGNDLRDKIGSSWSCSSSYKLVAVSLGWSWAFLNNGIFEELLARGRRTLLPNDFPCLHLGIQFFSLNLRNQI